MKLSVTSIHALVVQIASAHAGLALNFSRMAAYFKQYFSILDIVLPFGPAKKVGCTHIQFACKMVLSLVKFGTITAQRCVQRLQPQVARVIEGLIRQCPERFKPPRHTYKSRNVD